MTKFTCILFSLFISITFGQQNGDSENFNHFIVKFFALKDFQKERTILPLEYIYFDNKSDKIKIEYLNEENWKAIEDTTYVKSHYFRNKYDNLEHKLMDSGKRVFAYEGNETSTALFLYFELKDNKWLLIRKENLSD